MPELVINIETASYEQLETIVELSKEIAEIPGDIIEIGSWKCGTSIPLADANPHKLLYAFDLFGGMPYADRKEFANFADVDFEEIRQKASNLPNLHLVRGKHEVTVPAFAKFQRPISLLFMDSDWYESHVVALYHLAPFVVQNGLIVFHDWQFHMVRAAAYEVLKPEEWQSIEGKYSFDPPKQWLKVLSRA